MNPIDYLKIFKFHNFGKNLSKNLKLKTMKDFFTQQNYVNKTPARSTYDTCFTANTL